MMGTVFDLSSLSERLSQIGAPSAALEAWFGRLLHATTALTLADEFRPFPDVAAATLRSLLVRWGLNDDRAELVLAGLAELEPHAEVRDALDRLTAAAVPVLAVTNGTEENTRELLSRASLEERFFGILGTEEVGVYKPHPRVYERATQKLGLSPADVTLIAAHAWDVVGARAAGMQSVWVRRLERRWPLPVEEARVADDLAEAAALACGD